MNAKVRSFVSDAESTLRRLCDRIGNVAQDWLIALAEWNEVLAEIDIDRVHRTRDAFTLHLEAINFLLHEAGVWLEWTLEKSDLAPPGFGYVRVIFHPAEDDEPEENSTLIKSARAVESAAQRLLDSPIDVRATAFAVLKDLRKHISTLDDVRDALRRELDTPTTIWRKKPSGRTANPNHPVWYAEIMRTKEAMGLSLRQAVAAFNRAYNTNHTFEQVKKWGQRARRRSQSSEQNRAA